MNSIPKSDLLEALTLCKGAFISAAGFSLVINILQLVPTIYMLQVFDRVVPTGNLDTLGLMTLVLMVLFITQGVLEWVRSQILVRVSTRLEVLLNERLFKVAYKLALYSSGQRASTQPLDDLTGLRQFLTGSGLFAFFDAPWVPIYLAVMFLFHPWYGWVGVATAILLIVIAYIQEKATNTLLNDANNLAMAGRNLVNKNLRNAEVIDSMGMLPNIQDRWLGSMDKVLALQAIASSRAGVINAFSKLTRMSSQSLILAVGAYLVIGNEISSGLMMAGSILLGRALAPIDMVIGSWKSFISARGQFKRLNDLLTQMPAGHQKMSLPDPQGAFKLELATVVPPGAKTPVIKDITMSIVKGDVLGIIGPSGAGKSTFARALLGIWPTSSGRIRLDGAEIYNMNRDELGPFLGYLPQDIELFEGTISENIARFGVVVSEKVVEAARMADVHELILCLPDGYDTYIGANGINLSGGQRQRIGLARALYGNPVVVVLDEPNSNLDEQGELALARAIQRLKAKQTTVIVITHRNNVLANVDKLLVLKEGQLSVYGPRDQVLAHLQKAVQQSAQPVSNATPPPPAASN
ncbi:MAG: type I secretion system permease/ATPase [Methylomonas sp.]|nr:MAG: type I secretion system permease/ATPase [Methylomonas sp.]